MAAATLKTVLALFENAVETYENQFAMAELTSLLKPNAGDLQSAGNFVWRPVQQHAPIIDGWDLAGSETDIIEETYPALLGTPANDFVKQRADDLRDIQFWEKRGRQSGLRQGSELNKRIAAMVANTGSLFYRSDTTSGYNFIGQAQAILNERQSSVDDRYFVLNDRDNLTFASDLAGRQTLQGRPADTWKTGQIGENVAEFDVFAGSFLPNLTGGADPGTTVTADVSEAPEGGTVNATTGVVTNVDYRVATIAVTASTNYNVGDKVTFTNDVSGDTVMSLGLADKTSTGQAMTFTITEKPNATSVKIFPKPIAADDAALSDLEAAYANIDTQILTDATMDRVNIDASAKTNLFWCKESIEVLGGEIPAELLNQYNGMKVISSTMKNGQIMYMVYDGDIEDMSLRYRLFTWYGITNANPSANGVAVHY